MFAKKPSTPKPLWAVQLLTTEYLVDGSLDYDDSSGSWWFLEAQAGQLALETLNLKQASFQPTAGLNVSMPAAATWSTPSTAAYVACIPRDEASTAYALKQNSSWRNPIPAVVFVGPYSIRGNILSREQQLGSMQISGIFPMQQAVIDCLAPGARLTGLAAPYLLVHSLLLHGIVTGG
jgi:hypothetical protein